jgi:hypothetical protein
LLWVAIVIVIAAIARNARGPDDLDPRVKNPAVTGHPRPVSALWGGQHWMSQLQTGTAVVMAILVVVFVVMWRRYPRHPILLMAIAAEGIVWLDPVMNWAPYAVYNPLLWHWPETWPLASLAPTIEPFVVFGYVTFYFAPYFPAIWILRRLQRGRDEAAFVRRHPLLSLGLLTFAIGFVFDAALEIFCIRAGLYIYSQVVPFGSIWAGKAYQFPLLWESSLVTDVMITSAVLLYRHDDGVRVVEKLAARFRIWAGRPALRLFIVMFAMLNVSYLTYGLGFAILRWSGAATSVACPYPYPESKVYDPQGKYAEAGQPGPYLSGSWNGWESLHSGRPNVTTSPAGRCSPTSTATG